MANSTFIYRGRLHLVLKGEIYLYIGESIVDRVAALGSRVRIEVTDGSWARCVSDKYIESLVDSLQAAVRKNQHAG